MAQFAQSTRSKAEMFTTVQQADSKSEELVFASETFSGWTKLLTLMHTAFTLNVGKIDPPSTVFNCSELDLIVRATHEELLLAYKDGDLIGCLFLHKKPNELFLGRFAIAPQAQGSGLARRMMAKTEAFAIQNSLSRLTLETRVELRLNQQKFGALGFEVVGGRAHFGYNRRTTLRMVKRLSA